MCAGCKRFEQNIARRLIYWRERSVAPGEDQKRDTAVRVGIELEAILRNSGVHVPAALNRWGDTE